MFQNQIILHNNPIGGYVKSYKTTVPPPLISFGCTKNKFCNKINIANVIGYWYKSTLYCNCQTICMISRFFNNRMFLLQVRPWALSGRARYYRQTLLFCAHPLPQISALFSRKCYNYAGKVYVVNPVKTGTICQIVLQLPQVANIIANNKILGIKKLIFISQ